MPSASTKILKVARVFKRGAVKDFERALSLIPDTYQKLV